MGVNFKLTENNLSIPDIIKKKGLFFLRGSKGHYK